MILKGKKILISSITDSGILRVRSEIIKWMIKEGAEVLVATPKKIDFKKLEELGCQFIEISIDSHGLNPIKDYKVYKKYIKLLKEERPDLVLTFTTKPNIYCTFACKKLGIKYITNVTGRGVALATPGLIQRIMVFMLRKSLKNASCIFFQNCNDMSFFGKNLISRKEVYRLIPGSGVNLEKFKEQPYPEYKEDLHFSFISRILKSKGIDNYIEAAREIRKKYPTCVFHVLGDTSPGYEKTIKQAASEGVIVYHGRVNNVGEYIANSDCIIHPSYYPEGMANVILEAAATARPVITTNHPGCREGVNDGETGYIVRINDTGGLVNAIEKFIKMDYEKRVAMGKAGRRKIEKEFDRQIVTNAYINEIVNALNNSTTL